MQVQKQNETCEIYIGVVHSPVDVRLAGVIHTVLLISHKGVFPLIIHNGRPRGMGASRRGRSAAAAPVPAWGPEH